MKKFLVTFLILSLLASCSITYGATFKDTTGLRCEAQVERLKYLGIINGVSQTEFAPLKNVTRAEFAKMISNTMGAIDRNVAKNFNDISNHWAEDFIISASNAGYINGYPDGTFKPEGKVTYAESIAIMIRALGYNYDKDTASNWYDGYIREMKIMDLDKGLGLFNPNTAITRGDVAIILWNMITYKEPATAKQTILHGRFGEYDYIHGVKIDNISAYAGRVVYETSAGNFYVDENIDFSDLGGAVSGFLDRSSKTIVGMQIDEGMQLKKIKGNAKDIYKSRDDMFTSDKVYGFGERDYAEYIEVFVDEKTDKIYRIVFYDVRESHLAEELKITPKSISIESKDIYDESWIYDEAHNVDITIRNLRTESVKTIKASAVLVYDGKVTSWEDVPKDSVIREISKDYLYTYVHEKRAGELTGFSLDLNTLEVDGKDYKFHENCICQNTNTKVAMKLIDGLTRSDLQTIIKKDNSVTIYLNEYGEIVKLEFDYDIWALNEENARKEKYPNLKSDLAKIGIITEKEENITIKANGDADVEYEIRYRSLPGSTVHVISSKDDPKYEVGDLAFIAKMETQKSGEKKKVETKNNMEGATLPGLILGEFKDAKIASEEFGGYTFTKDTEIVEFSAEVDPLNDVYKYRGMERVSFEHLQAHGTYETIKFISDEEGRLLRVYAIRKIGLDMNLGIVKKITMEYGEKNVLQKMKVSIQSANGGSKFYNTDPVMGYKIGDIVEYNVIENKDTPDFVTIGQVYNHELIGSKHDLIVRKNSSNVITFENSDFVLDLNEGEFTLDGYERKFDDCVFAKIGVTKKNGEWIFGSVNTMRKAVITIKAGDRIAIDEISNVIAVYHGYRD